MASEENHEGVSLDSVVSSLSNNDPSNGQLDSASAVEDNILTPELRNNVFENELIRDKIFEYVFSSNGSGKILINKDVLTCRLVDHAWLDYITYRLQTSGSPEYTLDFQYCYQSKEHQNRRPKKYQVYKFLDTWVDFPGAGSRIPLFKMELAPFEKPMELYIQSLAKCLTRCGRSLSHLKLDLSYGYRYDAESDANCANYVAATGEINLHNLTELEVVLSQFQDDKPLVFLLLSRILAGCKRLTFLSLGCRYVGVPRWSRLFLEEILSGKSEQLPKTLVKLQIDVSITTELLEKLLLENFLPKLSWLKLGVRNGVDNHHVVSRIIGRYSRQLNYMCISYIFSDEPGPEINQSFPILETLTLKGQTPSMLRKWTQNSGFSCVKEFTVDFRASSAENVFTSELSKELHVAFPHVQKLEINFGLGLTYWKLEDGSIQNIFQYMPQLCDLSLKPNIDDYQRGAFTWDAILLGVTPEYAKTLAESPREEWDSINLSSHRTPSRSIVNLSRLTKFCLGDRFWSAPVSENESLISDVSFSFAFLRMPNLKTLILGKPFGATEEMACEWERQGREICGRVCRLQSVDVNVSEEENDDMSTSEEEDDISVSDEENYDIVIDEVDGGNLSVCGEEDGVSSVDEAEDGVSSKDGEEDGVSSADGEEDGVSSVDGEEDGVSSVDGEEYI